MRLEEFVTLFRKRWRTIAVVLLAVVGLSALFTTLSAKTYEATTRLFVSTASGGTSSDLLEGSTFSQNRVKSYADVMTSPRVLNPVIAKLDLGMTAAELREHVHTSVPADTVLIEVAVQSRSPERARKIADAIGKQFTDTVRDLETVDPQQRSPVKVSIIAEPTRPTSPVSPQPARNLALGLLLGLLLGVGVAVTREMFDTRIKTEKDCADVTAAPVIGSIAHDPDAPNHPLILQLDPNSPRAEAFRSLRTNLQFVDAANHPTSIVFTSSLPDEGKTTTVANLAIALAASGAKVCLVEADLRRPRLLGYLGLEGAIGLTSVLIGQAELEDVLQDLAHTKIMVLGAGPIPPNPSELLGSPAMTETLQTLQDRFDYVVIDAPPLLPVTDAAVLSTVADGVVVVVGAGTTTREQLRKSLQALEQVKARVLGLVLNRLARHDPDTYTYYQEGYPPPASIAEPSTRSQRRKQAVDR